jgi:nucleotide-binding universal stress UspA family protein
MVHGAAMLARRRTGDRRLPVVPLLGAALCVSLAIFQALAVREAGSVVAVWLALGIGLYLTLLASGARLADATAEARDPDLARLRGRSPLVLVPIANPASAASMVGVAATVRTPGVGRILLLSVVHSRDEPADEEDPPVRDAQTILGESLQRGFERRTTVETLFTVAPDPWAEIARVARLHRCEIVLLGAPRLREPGVEAQLEALIERLDVDVVILRAQRRWRIARVRRVLVPVGGSGDHSRSRARLLASLTRTEDCAITFLRSLPRGTSPELRRRAEQEIRALARDEAEGAYQLVVEEADDPLQLILQYAGDVDLIVMGLRRDRRGRRSFGALTLGVARECETPLVLIGGRRAGRRPPSGRSLW